MPVISTKDWIISKKSENRLVHVHELKIPVVVTPFESPNENHSVVVPAGYLIPSYWSVWLSQCKRFASYDPDSRRWVWSRLLLDRVSSSNAVVVLDRLEIRKKRKEEEDEFDRTLAELTKGENIPEDQWESFAYPNHYRPCDPKPTALQRILVNRYWDKPHVLIGASVGSGKTRVAIDILNARAQHKDYADSARIVLVVAPLGLHENWIREFKKWGGNWSVFRFDTSKIFWDNLERESETAFNRGGGVVIICTPQALSRPTIELQFKQHDCHPTFIVIDEAHRFFRNPANLAFVRLVRLRASAHAVILLTGTPTAKLEDYHALESLLSRDLHWKRAPYLDYQRLGDKAFFTSSGLFESGWTYERGIKEYHAHRIRTGAIFMADKRYYMKDSLPGLEQEELGDYADSRLSFNELFERHPALIKEAHELQLHQNPEPIKNQRALATTLLLRMQQLAAISPSLEPTIDTFVNDFLDPEEPCVFWVSFRNPPCEELQAVVKTLVKFGPCSWLMGEMTEKERWSMIDQFQQGKSRFMVAQVEAAGVGLTLTRACKQIFMTIPMSYLTISQCIGRLHRIGQDRDVTSYFNMTHPVACFSRSIYDKRAELNEHIPTKIANLLVDLARV